MRERDIIAQNIAGLRKKAGWTQAELAEKLDYSDKAISKWERGLSLPDAEMLYRIASLFRVDVDYLFKEHVFAALPSEQEKKLLKKEKTFKIIFVCVVIAIVLTLGGILIGSMAEIMGIAGQIRVYLFIVPCIPSVLLFINIVFGHSKRINLILASLIDWSLANALFLFYREFNLAVIYGLAAVIQIALVVFPLVISHFEASSGPKG